MYVAYMTLAATLGYDGGKGTHIQRVIFLCCVIAVDKKAKHRLALWSLVLS